MTLPDGNIDRHPDVPNAAVPRGVTPFFFSDLPLRGRLVRLGALTDILLSRHDNPDSVSKLCGEALALVASLSSALKFAGSFSLQIKGNGPVEMLLADCTDSGELRFYARLDAAQAAPALAADKDHAQQLLGSEGFLAFTVDQGQHADLYQGIVALEGESLQDMAMHYFKTSEQHDCWIRLCCSRTQAGWRAAALVLERIAAQGGTAVHTEQENTAQPWETASILAETITDDELLDETLPAERLLFRLFHSLAGVVVMPPRPLSYGCRCSQERLLSVLAKFSKDDLNHMTENGYVTMRCEFCNIDFRFEHSSLADAP